jgi:peptide/nickel transport system substrate-binding protein
MGQSMNSSEEFVPNEHLRRARSLKGWTQTELAERVGTSFEMVSRWERGVTVPSSYYRERLCAVLGQTPEELGLLRSQPDALAPFSSPHVFLAFAYSDAEKPIISHLKTVLQERGITPWNSRQLSRQGSGTERATLPEIIRTAQAILVIISPAARTSRHVRETLRLARQYQRPVCGVWIEGENLQECLPQDAATLTISLDVRLKEEGRLFEEIVFALERAGLLSDKSILPVSAKSSEQAPQPVAVSVSFPADAPLPSHIPDRRRRRSPSRSAAITLIGAAVLVIGSLILGGIEYLHLNVPKGSFSFPVRGGTWIDEFDIDIDSLLPNTGFFPGSNTLIDNALYLPLFYGNDGTGAIYPGAATEVPSLQNGGISADARTWTFHLRPHLVWSDGQPYDARDVDYTWRFWANSRSNAVYTEGVDQIASADLSTDRLTITFHLKRAYVPFLQFWVNGFVAPLPAHHFGKMAPEAILNSPDLLNPQVVNGPFVLKESVPGDHFTLVRNTHFYRAREGLPYLDRVIFRIRDDPNIGLKDLQAGSITSAYQLDYGKLVEYRRLSNYVVTPAPTSSSFEALLFNFRNGILSTHPEVRLAMAEAIDRTALIAVLPQGQGMPLCTDHGSFYHPGYQPKADCPVFDPVAANQLLDDNGWVRSADGVRTKQRQRLDFEYVTGLNYAPWRLPIEALIQRNLKEIGIKIDIQYYPIRRLYAVVLSGKPSPPSGAVAGRFDITEANEFLPGYDPDDYTVLGCDSFPPKGVNVTSYCNPTLEALYKREQETTDAGVRQQIFDQIHEIYLTEFPLIVLYGWIEFTIARKGTHNHQASALDGETTANIWEWWCDNRKC